MRPVGRRMMAIFNPRSGGGEFRRDLPLILDALTGLGYEVDARETQGVGDAIRLGHLAVDSGCDVVCAIGGDGTVNEVINGIAGSGVTLAIIPTGTVNVLAMELGIPLDPPDACKLAAQGHVIDIDLGLAGERYFALMAGAGVDAAVIAGMNPVMKKALKEAAFAIQGVATALTGDFPLIRVETGGRCIDGYFVVIGNSSNYGGAFGITPDADMRDGLLDVCVLTDKSFMQMSCYWLAALVSSHLRTRTSSTSGRPRSTCRWRPGKRERCWCRPTARSPAGFRSPAGSCRGRSTSSLREARTPRRGRERRLIRESPHSRCSTRASNAPSMPPTLEVLSQTGVKFRSAKALGMLRAAGARSTTRRGSAKLPRDWSKRRSPGRRERSCSPVAIPGATSCSTAAVPG